MRTSLPLALACVALACAGTPPDRPATFSGPPHITRIYAVDAQGTRLPDVLLYAADGTPTSPAPPSYTRYRVEFDQPIDGATLEAHPQNDLMSPAATRSGTGTFTRSFCAPGPAGAGVQLTDVAGGTAIPSSICYNPTTVLGSNPNIFVIPGAGLLSGTSTAAPFSCNSFAADTVVTTTPNTTAPSAKENSTYTMTFNPNAIVSGGDASQKLAPPTGTGWSGNVFTFKTAPFAIMAVGAQNSLTGFFDWVAKPFGGFQADSPALDYTQEVDCDPAAVISRPGCRPPSDGSPFLIVLSEAVGTARRQGAGLKSAVNIYRSDSPTIPIDYSVQTWTGDRGARTIAIYSGTPARNFSSFWEPGQEYTVTLDTTKVHVCISSPPSGTTCTAGAALGTDTKTYKFIAGPGLNGPGHFAETLGSFPAGGSTGNDPTLDNGIGGINVLFQYPVEAGTGPNGAENPANWVVKVNNVVVPGTPSIDPGLNSQSMTWSPTAFTAAYDATVTVQVKNIKSGPNTKHSGEVFPTLDVAYTTARFHLLDVEQVSSTAVTSIGGQRTVSADIASSGQLAVVFNGPVDMTTVTGTTLTLKDGTTTIPTPTPRWVTIDNSGAAPVVSTCTAACDTVILTASPVVPAKFAHDYSVVATTGIKEIGGGALKSESCTTGDCSDIRGFTTAPISVTLSPPVTTSGGTGTTKQGYFEIAFSTPIDQATVPNPTSNVKLFKLSKNPDNTPGTPVDANGVPISCTWKNSTTIACTPTPALELNTYYQAVASFTGVKPASPLASGVPVDPSTVFQGSATSSVLTACQ